VLEAASDAMLVVTRAGEILAANLQAEKLYGFSREQLIGKVVDSLIPERFRDRHRQRREPFLANPEIQFMQVFRWVLHNGVPRFNRDHSFAGYIVTGVDVTSVSWLKTGCENMREP
jgi:PAS domain S-box-containing protein